MAFDELLAKRIRAIIKLYPDEFTKKNVGKLSFLYKGKNDHITLIDFTNRPMRDFICLA